MKAIVRYTLLRLLIFFGCIALLWLLGLRGRGQEPWLVVGGALLSMVVAAVVLRPYRAEYVAELADRVQRRRDRGTRAVRTGTDETVEDAWSEDASPGPAPQSGAEQSAPDAGTHPGRPDDPDDPDDPPERYR